MSLPSTLSASSAPTVPEPFTCRAAIPSDCPALSNLFIFKSFNAPFWHHLFPPNDASVKFWNEAWLLGINDKKFRTFIVFDSSVKSEQDPEGKPVAFARWIVPQEDGNIDNVWPDILEEWDTEVHDTFWAGMHGNRAKMMEKRPHWMLELLGTHDDYQRTGLGSAMLKWGCDLADKEGLEVYLDASERGAPFYRKHFGFEGGPPVTVPDRPETYGTFSEVSLARPIQK